MSSLHISKRSGHPPTKKRRLNPEIDPDLLNVIASKKRVFWKASVLATIAFDIGNVPEVGFFATSFMTPEYFVRLLQQSSHSFLGEILDEIASCSPPDRVWQPVVDAILSLVVKEDPISQGDTSDYKYAALQSWNREFVGDAQHALWDHIKRHFKADYQIYAYYSSIVQSSGMGKSRLVDELSKHHFVIPMTLRGPGFLGNVFPSLQTFSAPTNTPFSGYPPRDGDVYSYLTELTRDPLKAVYAKVYWRMTAFLQALFECTTERLQSGDFKDVRDLPATFRKKMTEGQTFKSPNKFRSEFYRNVIAQAQALEQQQSHQPTVSEACSRLASFIQPKPVRRSLDGPAFLVVFDEAHVLRDQVIPSDPRTASWSPFTVLRHVLRALNKELCFSLFLSTTAGLPQFASSQAGDASSRILFGQPVLIPPFTDLGFDTLAHKIAVDGTADLVAVASVKHMAHLGRPLFGSMYDNGLKSIIQFAAEKLLNSSMDQPYLSTQQQFACLSHRIPLELYSTHHAAESNRIQVEEHMRICLKVDPGFGAIESTCPSEPLLSEAAYTIMNHKSFNVPMAMGSVLDRFAVDLGDCGEFIAMLLLIVARDKAVSANPDSSSIMSLCSFLTDGLWKSPELKEAIQKDFPDAVLYFNHFIKVHTSAVLKTKRLLQIHTRGAAVQCADDQEAINAAISFLPNDTSIHYNNQGLILVRIQNEPSYTDEYDEEVFQPIDPRELGILPSSDPAVPVIKIFFALAANKPALHFKRFAANEEYNAVVYHIWCAGLSPEVFNAIDQDQADAWVDLLKDSHPWEKVYEGPDSNEDLRRAQNPGVACDLPHWSSWVEDRSDS